MTIQPRALWTEEHLEAAEHPRWFDHLCVVVCIIAFLYIGTHWLIAAIRTGAIR